MKNKLIGFGGIMRRGIAALLLGGVCIGMVACGMQTSTSQQGVSASVSNNSNTTSGSGVSNSSNAVNETPTYNDSNALSEMGTANSTTAAVNSPDYIADAAEADFEQTLAAMEQEYKNLVTEINSFDAYVSQETKVEKFYESVVEAHKQLCIRMDEYALAYVNAILASSDKHWDKYKELGDVYDDIYSDIGGDMYDDIYSGFLSDLYDDFYSGILSDAYDTVGKTDYDKWSEMRSDEYDFWSDARSEVYDDWSDMRSDIYDFWSDVRSDIYDEDDDAANKRITKFVEKIEKRRNS